MKYESGFALDITNPPADRIVNVGRTATFSVGVAGTAPFTFQWRRNGTNLEDGGNVYGATTSNLTLTGVTTNDEGNVTVVVSNPAGSMTTAAAVLTILPNAPRLLFNGGPAPNANNLIFSWPTNWDEFALQSATNLTPPVVWIDVSSPPVVVGGNWTVTNSPSGNARFYRLRKPQFAEDPENTPRHNIYGVQQPHE